VQFWVPIHKPIGNAKKKSNMKMSQNFEPRLIDFIDSRLLENSKITGFSNSSYGI